MLFRSKIEGGEVKSAPVQAKSSGEVVDLLAALQRSVDAAKSARGEVDQTTEDSKGTPRKTSKASAPRASAASGATKKPRARKAAAKTAKKTAKKAS